MLLSIAAVEYIKDVLAGLLAISKFETIYPRPGMAGLLTPQELDLLRLNQTIQQRPLDEAKKKRISVEP